MWRILSALGLHLVGPRVMLGVLLAAIAGLTISLWEIDRLRTQAHDAEAALADATQSINDQNAEIIGWTICWTFARRRSGSHMPGSMPRTSA